MNPNELLHQMQTDAYRKDNKLCPFCGKDMSNPQGQFRDALSYKEFCISGLCQDCQDKVLNNENI